MHKVRQLLTKSTDDSRDRRLPEQLPHIVPYPLRFLELLKRSPSYLHKVIRMPFRECPRIGAVVNLLTNSGASRPTSIQNIFLQNCGMTLPYSGIFRCTAVQTQRAIVIMQLDKME